MHTRLQDAEGSPAEVGTCLHTRPQEDELEAMPSEETSPAAQDDDVDLRWMTSEEHLSAMVLDSMALGTAHFPQLSQPAPVEGPGRPNGATAAAGARGGGRGRTRPVAYGLWLRTMGTQCEPGPACVLRSRCGGRGGRAGRGGSDGCG
jgi:hypothetical protein